MQDAARDEYAYAICTLGEIVQNGYGWKLMRSGYARVLGRCVFPRPETNIKSTLNWNADAEFCSEAS
jgi:hypothetical protein